MPCLGRGAMKPPYDTATAKGATSWQVLRPRAEGRETASHAEGDPAPNPAERAEMGKAAWPGRQAEPDSPGANRRWVEAMLGQQQPE